MSLSIAPVLPSGSAQAATLAAALKPGTIVTAQVLQLLDANLVRMTIANLTLDVATTLPLQTGQTLQLAVTQTKDGISFAQVLPETATRSRGQAVMLDDFPLAPKLPVQAGAVRPALSPEETRAVTVAVQAAATKQAGLSPLFANLTVAVTSASLPQPVLVAAAQLLALRQPHDKALTGADLKAAVASSGLTMEASLAVASSRPPVPDMKAALGVLRQTLATWLGNAADAPALPQTKQRAPQIKPDVVSSQPQAMRQARASVAAPSVLADMSSLTVVLPDLPTPEPGDPLVAAKTVLPPVANTPGETAPLIRAIPSPPFRGALPSAQPVASPSLVPDTEPAIVAQQLIADTDGALARQTLLQIASLPERVDMTTPRNETIQPRWNFEIPFVTPQGTAITQFEIARDGGTHDNDPVQRVWRARFSLDIEPAGPVHALISFSGDITSVKMWAERPETVARLRANATRLGASLDRAEMKAGDIVIADGTPVRDHGPPAGHFLNRAS